MHGILFYHDHLHYLRETSRLHEAEVQASGKCLSIPDNFIMTSRLSCRQQGGYFLSEQVVDADLHLAGGWKLVADGCAGIIEAAACGKGIRVIGFQKEL